MRQKKITLCVMFLFGFLQLGLHAQTLLNLKERTGTLTSFELNSLQKLTFDSRNITVNRKSGTASVFALANIKNIKFDRTTAIDVVREKNSKNILLYPNPVVDQLNVQYKSPVTEKVRLQILDMQGQVVYMQNLDIQTGINSIIISVNQLQHGLYFCLLQNRKEIESSKFFKN
ncbi:MAG: T9SS type A sorting domain-containing protein [Bacteroidales bacterium]|nr:T9SS type A sorting domain-containing protein [Bacteroidales bacterium]